MAALHRIRQAHHSEKNIKEEKEGEHQERGKGEGDMNKKMSRPDRAKSKNYMYARTPRYTALKRQKKTWISISRCPRSQIKNLTTLHRRNTTFAISKQVLEFESNTIQTTSENRALPTKVLFKPFFILHDHRLHSQLLL